MGHRYDKEASQIPFPFTNLLSSTSAATENIGTEMIKTPSNEPQLALCDRDGTVSKLDMPDGPEGQDHDAENKALALAVEEPRYSIFTLWEKRWIVLGGSLAAFFSPLTAQIYLPALNVLAHDFHVTPAQINLTVTTYMIFQGVTPMFIGGFADTAGRRPAFIVCFVIYIGANIGLALSKNYASIMVVRCLQSAGSSTTVALCQAVVADIVTSAERGQYIGITAVPVVLAPSLGPVIGGLLSQYLGWRWIFWFLTILASFCLIMMLIFFPETCREIVHDGSVRPPKIYRTFWQVFQSWHRHRKARKSHSANHDLTHVISNGSSRSAAPKFKLTPPNLLGSLIMLFEIETGLLLFYSGLIFAGFYAIATALPSQFATLYGYNNLEIGLMYLPMAGGSIMSALIIGPATNWNYRRHAKRLGVPVQRERQMDLSDFPIERARIEVGLPLLVMTTAVMFSWGWVLQSRTSVAVPIVLMFLVGFSLIGVNNTMSVLLVDIKPGAAGAAVAANNLTRCLLGAIFSAVIEPMINAMGQGWAYTLIGMLYILFSPMLFAIMAKGIEWRKKMKAKKEKENQKEEEKRRGKVDKSAEESGAKITDEEGQQGTGVLASDGENISHDLR